MKTIFEMMVALFVGILLVSCGHNTGSFLLGDRTNIGIDPQNMTANISHESGMHVMDISRENSSWRIYTDSKINVDSTTGEVTGIRMIEREVGPQITGYLVDLAKENPELAKIYLESLKKYWEYKAENAASSAVNQKSAQR